MSFRRTRAMFEKEFRHILRDSRSLIMALFLPLFQMLLFGYALNLDVDRIPTLIYDGDHSNDSRALIERFRGSRFFEIEGYAYELWRDRKRHRQKQNPVGHRDSSRLFAAPEWRRQSQCSNSAGWQRLQYGVHRPQLRGGSGAELRAAGALQRPGPQRRPARWFRPSMRACASGTTARWNPPITSCRA